jgi:CO/xanthine dehydrogenase Mo-binding subunit
LHPDARLLTGGGRFADETNLPGQGYACMVRSPHAHALIASIDTGPAEGMPGVIAVLTGSDANLAAKFPGECLPRLQAEQTSFAKQPVGRRTQTSPTDLFVAWPLTGV